MKINIKGAIVRNDSKWIYDWLEMDAVSPKDVIKAIESTKDNEDLEVEISSGGGDVYAGSEIYTALKEYKGKVVGKIVGLAGSAASVVAMACQILKITPTGQVMIHRVSVAVSGNTKTFESISELLASHDVGIANAYMLKTGKDKKEILEMMDKETYFNAKTALDNGFVDEIMFDNELRLSASTGDGLISEKVIEKMRNYLAKQKEQPNTNENENGEAIPQPTSSYKLAQQQEINRIKNKIYGGIL